jgi:hypothetical protein
MNESARSGGSRTHAIVFSPLAEGAGRYEFWNFLSSVHRPSYKDSAAPVEAHTPLPFRLPVRSERSWTYRALPRVRLWRASLFLRRP